jgi:hypothetical protein
VAVAVLTLALAIGANAVVLGILNALILRGHTILRPVNVPQAQIRRYLPQIYHRDAMAESRRTSYSSSRGSGSDDGSYFSLCESAGPLSSPEFSRLLKSR